MGTPRFATGPLKALIEAGFNIAGVVTAPDKPSGRGLQINESEVKKFASLHNLNILQPVSLKDPDFIKSLQDLEADLFVVVAFRMLPKEVWSIPKYGCFNLHASLLPQYRGAAPINYALINGEKITGVTTFFIDSKIDTGEILYQEVCHISENDDAGTLHDKLMALGSSLVVKTAEAIFRGEAMPAPQKEDILKLKSAPKLDKEICRIDWGKTNLEIWNLVRGLSPSPAAYTEFLSNNKSTQIKILTAEITTSEEQASPGRVIKESKCSLIIKCGSGFLRILELQPAGKRRMKASEFLAGIKDPDKCLMK